MGLSAELILDVRGLETSFGSQPVVKKISYQIKKGELLGIVGESGCGKSVTSSSIMRLIEPPGRISAGQVFFRGANLLELSEKEMAKLRGRQIGMIFQEPMTALNPVMRVGDQIVEQLRRHFPILKPEAWEKTVELLNLVGIPSASERAKCYPHELSGGMRQRIMIAMALSCEPALLIADEPTTALDVTIQAQILELLQQLQERFGMSIQFISHDLGVISEIADQVMVMYAGEICEVAPASEIFRHALHPYTQALLKSRPQRGTHARGTPLTVINGSPPLPSEQRNGCAFSARCAYATARCLNEKPVLDGSAAHQVACFQVQNFARESA